MKITISDGVVRKNVELFKKLLEKQRQKEIRREEKEANLKEQIYQAFINKITGDIYFSDILEDKELVKSKQWKPISFRLSFIPTDEEKGAFAIDEEGKEGIFFYEDLAPLAYRIMAETISTLNRISTTKGNKEKTPEALFVEFSHLDIETASSAVSFPQQVVYKAWHEIDRVQAEKMLRKYPSGSFLFRKGEYASILEEELSEKFHIAIICFTLTYKDLTKKIVDQIVVNKGKKWVFYNDDPSLENDPYFLSIEELLKSCKEYLHTPLLNPNSHPPFLRPQ